MRITFLVSLITVVASVLWSCKDNGTGPALQGGSSPYYPLAVGDTWVYNDYNIDSNGVILTNSKWTDVKTVTGTIGLDGYLAYIVRDLTAKPRNPSQTIYPIYYYTFDSRGNLLEFLDTSSTNDTLKGVWNIRAYLGNRTFGSSVLYRQYLLSHSSALFTTIDRYLGESNVQVPAGSFNAEYYLDTTSAELNSSNFNTTYPGYSQESLQAYYVRGIGLVKDVEITHDSLLVPNKPPIVGTSGLYEELVSYSAK